MVQDARERRSRIGARSVGVLSTARLTGGRSWGTLDPTRPSGGRNTEAPMSRLTSSRLARPTLVGALATLVLLGAAACSPGTPALTDPAEILQKGAASLGEMKSFHLRGAIDGEFPLSIGGAGGGAPLPLNGTTLDGDVDVANGELAVELMAPALLNLRVNLVVADGAAYLKAPIITGDGWVKQPATGGIGADPGAAIDGLATFLARPELKPEKLPDARCAGTDCYSVRFTVPAADVRDALGSLGGAIPGLSGDAVGDVTVTAGVRKDDLQLATLDLEIPGGGTKPLTISLELSKVDQPVTITAPPADQVKDAPGG